MTETLPETLRALGYRVDENTLGFEVRLPLLCSVRVRTEGQNLDLDPRFGLVSRTAATWGTALIIVVLCFFSVRAAPLDQLYLSALTGLFAVVWDVYRYVLTEHAMATVRQVYLAIRPPQ